MKLSKILADNKRMMMLPVALAELLVEEFGPDAEVLFSNISSTGQWSVYLRTVEEHYHNLHGTFDGERYYR
jgi:hypothetical protein